MKMKQMLISLVIGVVATVALAQTNDHFGMSGLVKDITDRAVVGDVNYFVPKMDPHCVGLATNLMRMIQRSGMASDFRERCSVQTNGTVRMNYHIPERGAHFKIDMVRSNSIWTVRMFELCWPMPDVAVPRDQWRYVIYDAQRRWHIGNLDEAWRRWSDRKRDLPHAWDWLEPFGQDPVQSLIPNMDPEFILWIIEVSPEREEWDLADNLCIYMKKWVASNAAAVATETRAGLMVAEAQLLFLRRDYPKARRQFEFIATNSDFEGCSAAIDAAVCMADIDRLTTNWPSAEKICADFRHKGEGNPYALIKTGFLMALIKYDQKDYEGAREILEDFKRRSPRAFQETGERLLDKVNFMLKREISN